MSSVWLAAKIALAIAGVVSVVFILIGIAWGESEWIETRREANMNRHLNRIRELEGLAIQQINEVAEELDEELDDA